MEGLWQRQRIWGFTRRGNQGTEGTLLSPLCVAQGCSYRPFFIPEQILGDRDRLSWSFLNSPGRLFYYLGHFHSLSLAQNRTQNALPW